jgi:hypothetical protein
MKKNPAKYPSIKKALGDVLKSVDILDCTDNGAIKFTPDSYIKKAMARNSLSRAFGTKVKLHKCTEDQIEAIAQGNSDYLRNNKVGKSRIGDTRTPVKANSWSKHQRDNTLKKAREVCITILENSDILVYATNSKSVHEGLNKVKRNKEYQECCKEEFGIDYKLLDFLFKNNIIEQNWASALHDL